MLDGWYCRSIANMQANETSGTNGAVPEPPQVIIPPNDYSSDSSRRSSSASETETNYRERYLIMKRSLKYLLYENECFQDALKCSQRRLLSASRDRTYLLDRLLMYEKGYSSSSESEDTESSDDGADYRRAEALKRKMKMEPGQQYQGAPPPNRNAHVIKRKRPVIQKKPANVGQVNQPGAHSAMVKVPPVLGAGLSTDGHMTPEEVERHLQSRQSYLELLPERAPPTVPTEMFSNDPSLDSRRIPLVESSKLPKRSISESNDVLENSPNVEEWFD